MNIALGRIKYRIRCETEGAYKYEWLDSTAAAPTQCPADHEHTIDAAATIIIDSDYNTTVSTFLDANALVTDPVTGIKGPFDLMQILQHRKDLYNDSDNPLYDADHTPILGSGGSIVSNSNRINNLETIHAKHGWHNQQVVEGSFTRPKDVLIYYGWMNSFNSGVNVWNNEKVAQEMAQYSIVVLGDGVQAPTHGDYANTSIIIPRIKALNPSCQIFGYVTVNQAYEAFETKANQWNVLAIDGIFMDEAGYDYGKNRSEFNDRVDYVHGQTSANICFANAWNLNHILGTTNDPSYPNTTYNTADAQSNLTANDWILLESFPINTTAYTASTPDGYESKTDWASRGSDAISKRATYGVNVAACGIINDGNSAEDELFAFGFISAMMFSLEAFGTSDTSYGASSAKTKFISRPDVTKMGKVWTINPSVQVDVGDSEIYHRYSENSKMSLDFSDSAQGASIAKY